MLLAVMMLVGLVPTAVLASESGGAEKSPWSGKSAVFVGDSITAGSGTTKIYYEYLKEALGFGSVTAMGVAGSCISNGSDYGDSNSPLIGRYKTIPSASYIQIFMGTNDFGHATPIGAQEDTQSTTFYGALNTIIPYLLEAHKNSKIVFVTPLHRNKQSSGNTSAYDNVSNKSGHTLEDYVEVLKEVCDKYCVTVIDLYTECTLDPTDAETCTIYMPDGLHPNAAGHELIAGIMESHIRAITPPEKAPEPETELIHGNKFTSSINQYQQNRASSRINLYLEAGTKITLKNPEIFQWACTKTDGETSSNNLGYFPDSSWSDKETAVVEANGWVGFVFKYRNETQVFDLTKPLSDYITIETPSGPDISSPSENYSEKTIAFYGDSVVGQTNGSWSAPFTTANWATLVGKYFGFGKVYSRGVGGQMYRWNNCGGSVTFVDKETGEYKGRQDGTSFDAYTGEIEDSLVITRGCASSYHRITSMFPESIRKEIDYVFVIYHNDAGYGTQLNSEAAIWESGSTVDKEWAASEYYDDFGGDYNITTTAGAIASTVMKLKAVLPNAKIILGTPLSGRGDAGELNPEMSDSATVGTLSLRNLVLRMAKELSVHCVDVYGTCGINGINRTEYITDSIHPNRFGGEMLARGIIGGLKDILTPETKKSDWIGKPIVVYSDTEENAPIYSYERILATFDDSAREDIECVFVTFNNASFAEGAVVWKKGGATDDAWTESEHFQKYGGDYDVSCKAGEIASAIMKLQAVLPNAVIVFCLPDSTHSGLRKIVEQTALEFSIPCIDEYTANNIEGSLTDIIPKFSKTKFGDSVSGTTSFAHATVSVAPQGIYGFEAGKNYEYTITPNYNGKISMYYAYKNTSKSTCFNVITIPMALSSVECVAGVSIAGTFVIPSKEETGQTIDFIVIRTYTPDKVSIDYSFAEAKPAPAITSQPKSTTAEVGERFIFTVGAMGENLTYQWYYKDASMESFAASSVKSATYSFEMTSFRIGREYYCVVTNGEGISVRTDTVKATVPLRVSEQPQGICVNVGESAVITVSALGECLTYQWYYKNRGGKEFAPSCYTGRTYSVTMADFCHMREVYCVITDAYGNTVTTETVTMSRQPMELKIIRQPENVTAAIGETFCINASAQGEGLTYQWYYKDGYMSDFALSSNKSSAYSYSMESYRDGRQVYCVITDASGASITTEVATISLVNKGK